MKALSLETTKILDKLYNLRGKDSVILVEMDKDKEKAESTLERTTEEKSNLENKITELEAQHKDLETQGEKLKELLSGIDKKEFQIVLDSLQIDFDPEAINAKVEEKLPKTIADVTDEQQKAEKQLVSVEEEMENAITTIQELGIRRDTALSNQEKLNEYFELALSGKINITRDSITALLEQFDFNEEEQREAAKILMFPEDALYDYDEKVKNADVAGKSISEVISEAKEAPTMEDEEKSFEVESNDELVEKIKTETKKAIEDIQSISIEKEDDLEPVTNPFEFETTDLDSESKDLNIDDFILTDNDEEKKETSSDDSLEDYLNSLGFNYLDFQSQDLDELKANLDKEVISTNVELAKSNDIDLDIFTEHVSLLYDKELVEKVNMLLNIGKEPIDIYLNPSILVKYTTEKLKNAIALLESNGMDPKNVPLMAY